MRRLERERRAFIAAQGLDLERVEYRGKHMAFVCAEGLIICGRTPSDRRERANFQSLVRRMGRM